MIIHIIKRDGRKVPFNIEKIANAIFRAAQSCGGTDFNTAMDTAAEVCRVYENDNNGKVPTVEEIQDLVEKTLIEKGHAKTAKAYILYRYERTRSREMKTNLMCVLDELTFSAAKDSALFSARAQYGRIKEWFAGREKERQAAVREADEHLTNVFRFLSRVYGEGQEMVLFLTELSAGYHSLRFLNEHGNESYFRLNRLLLLRDDKNTLRNEVISLME
jgi:ribonucleotide reductase alpha subunit